MNKILKVYYWSPYTSKVATIRAVLNSAISLKKYSNGKIIPKIIDAFGEWKDYSKEISNAGLNYSLLVEQKKFLKSEKIGFFKSRIYFFLIFIKCFLPLKKLILNEKPDYLIIHLLTSLPLILNTIFKFNTKIILRISGYPKMNFFRKILWKVALKRIYLITCPTEGTRSDIIKLNICDKAKVLVLKDPIINVKKIFFKKNESVEENYLNNYFLSIGRFTKQKNFLFLVKTFSEYSNNNNSKLLIIGEGEQKIEIQNYINKNSLSNKILLLGYKKNIFPYIKKSKCFILSSLWEDPGFVIVESAFCNKPIISSDCKNGPSAILSEGNGGFLYKTNSKKDLLKKLNEFDQTDKVEINKMLLKTKKKIKDFTLFSHYLTINNFFVK